MSLTNGNAVSKETWEAHNKMMLEPLVINDSEVCVSGAVYWQSSGNTIHILRWGDDIKQ